MKVALICFSLTGQQTGERLCRGLEAAGMTAELDKKSKYLLDSIQISTSAWAGEKFSDSDALIFIGATGIAVRSIAPYVASKKSDPAVLVVDECFLDFLAAREALTAKTVLRDAPNLIILKAFTKLYAMAGVRLGYALCSDAALLDKMRAAGQPWAVSGLAQAAGLAALEETAYADSVRTLIADQRPRLAAGLRALGLRVVDGQANYLLFRAPADFGAKLRRHGAVVRGCGNYPGLDETWYRTAVRTQKENEQLLKIMREVLA